MSILEVRGLKKSFGEVEVLENISFSVEKGDAIAVIGPSGSGKSTMLRCLIGLERADGGDIIIDGSPLMQNGVYLPDKQMRETCSRMGMVFQSFNLFPHMTVMDNLIAAPVTVRKMPKSQAIELAKERLDEVGLLDKANSYPSALSGGQKQRVAIARALMMD
ncbi:MAG: amino acid ABC transporter ATP-binding protein, partial [Oscillospiraceae bacterium]|nr:amino acid ABC transporter ATP-binding protein [Oscillospiraceae bacterium]